MTEEIPRLSRITSILTLLKSKRILTAKHIAQKFHISTRTAYRDIRTLEESGVPIITVEGKGFSLMEGYTIPPVTFTESEANALITAEHLINQVEDESVVNNFKEALTKIKAIFRCDIKEKSELLSDRILILKSNGNGNKTSDSLSEIQLAITGFKLVKIKYQKPDSDESTTRVIEPLAIYTANEKWILIAWCRLRKDFRAFRIDRIKECQITEQHFENRNFDIREYFTSCFEKYFYP